MGADLQYSVRYSSIGPIFDKVVLSDKREVEFIRETSENKYTMRVDLSDIFDHVMAEYDFDEIMSTRSDIKMYEADEDVERVEELRKQLLDEFSPEQLENYDEFNGDYRLYAEYLGKKILDNMDEYSSDLEDTLVLVEAWL